MSILSFILVLIVIGVVVYGIKLAIAGAWKELIWLGLGVFFAVIILQMFGIKLPDIPRVQ